MRPTKKADPACPSWLHGRWPNCCAVFPETSAYGQGNRDRGARTLPDHTHWRDGSTYLSTRRETPCLRRRFAALWGALSPNERMSVARLRRPAAPSGALRQQARALEATAEGYTLLCAWLAEWGAHETLLVGLEATGSLWEPLYEAMRRSPKRGIRCCC